MRSTWKTGGLIAALALLLTWPLLVLLKKVFERLDSESLKLLTEESTLSALWGTLKISLGTTFLSALIALPLAWILSRTKLKGGGTWRTLFSLPYAIPPYVGAIAWIILANPSSGLLNKLWGETFINIYSLPGLVWVMSSFFYTFILLGALSALDRIDPSLEEAARLSGAGHFELFFKFNLPLIRPALLSGLVLVFLASSASFGVPALIGTPAGHYFLTTKIYTLQRMGSLNGLTLSGLLATLLLGLAVISLFIQNFLSRNKNFQVVSGKSSRDTLYEWGKIEPFIQVFLTILFLIFFGVPLLGVTYSALSKVQGVFSFDNLTLRNFAKVFFETDETPRALINSLLLAIGAATAASFVGVVIAYLRVKMKARGSQLLEIIAAIPYATPGTVLALGFILASTLSLGSFRFSLYNTLTLMGLAYFVKYLNFSLRASVDGLGQIDDSLAEAARVSGAGPIQTIKTIWVPLLLPSLVASWFLVFMPAFSELTMSVLLTGPGLETLGTLLFQLQEYADASGGGASVMALLVIFVVIAINSFVKWFSKGRYGL